MDFLPPSGGVFRLSHLGVIAGYPMQTVMRLSRCGAGFGNKKSPHNNLNLTIPSGVTLVRVCYVAIRKSKTCSGSFGIRAGTLSKICYIKLLGQITTKIESCQQKLLKIRCFRQLARKNDGNLGKKRGLDSSFCLQRNANSELFRAEKQPSASS